jgi:hypothetical protein
MSRLGIPRSKEAPPASEFGLSERPRSSCARRNVTNASTSDGAISLRSLRSAPAQNTPVTVERSTTQRASLSPATSEIASLSCPSRLRPSALARGRDREKIRTPLSRRSSVNSLPCGGAAALRPRQQPERISSCPPLGTHTALRAQDSSMAPQQESVACRPAKQCCGGSCPTRRLPPAGRVRGGGWGELRP